MLPHRKKIPCIHPNHHPPHISKAHKNLIFLKRTNVIVPQLVQDFNYFMCIMITILNFDNVSFY